MKDKQIEKLMMREAERQDSVINLIASENYVSDDVRNAVSSVFMNKYAEGYPGRRYYGGNSIVDELEVLTQERALHLFGLSPKKWAVNVQPHSGSPANVAVYLALIPHDGSGRIMGMSLTHGGHLTHGHGVSLTGKMWMQIPYGVSEKNERIDYEALMTQAKKERPHVIVAGFTAYPRKIDWKKFRAIADAAGAYLMVDMSHISGLVAGKAHPSPFPYADVVTTTTHKTLRGPRGALIFSRIDEREIPAKIDKAVFPGMQGGPHEHTIAGIAVALQEASKPAFEKYARQVVLNAHALATRFTELGWHVVSGGTDNHLLLLDTWAKGISGKTASERLEQAGIIVNMNTIPHDTRKPLDPSGIRIGTAGETTRGAKEADMRHLAEVIDAILLAP